MPDIPNGSHLAMPKDNGIRVGRWDLGTNAACEGTWGETRALGGLRAKPHALALALAPSAEGRTNWPSSELKGKTSTEAEFFRAGAPSTLAQFLLIAQLAI